MSEGAGNPHELLTPGEVQQLFCERLKIGKSTYYGLYREALPWRYCGPDGRSIARVARGDAAALLELAASGRWREAVEGAR